MRKKRDGASKIGNFSLSHSFCSSTWPRPAEKHCCQCGPAQKSWQSSWKESLTVEENELMFLMRVSLTWISHTYVHRDGIKEINMMKIRVYMWTMHCCCIPITQWSLARLHGRTYVRGRSMGGIDQSDLTSKCLIVSTSFTNFHTTGTRLKWFFLKHRHQWALMLI